MGYCNILRNSASFNEVDYEQYGYNSNGNRTCLRTRDGSVLAYSNDALHRVTAKAVPERTGLAVTHTREVNYRYDLCGLQLIARFDRRAGERVSTTYDLPAQARRAARLPLSLKPCCSKSGLVSSIVRRGSSVSTGRPLPISPPRQRSSRIRIIGWQARRLRRRLRTDRCVGLHRYSSMTAHPLRQPNQRLRHSRCTKQHEASQQNQPTAPQGTPPSQQRQPETGDRDDRKAGRERTGQHMVQPSRGTSQSARWGIGRRCK